MTTRVLLQSILYCDEIFETFAHLTAFDAEVPGVNEIVYLKKSTFDVKLRRPRFLTSNPDIRLEHFVHIQVIVK